MKDGRLPPEALSATSFWGQILKHKCFVCLQDSGWKTVDEAKDWEKRHRELTQHQKFTVSMRKFT